MSVQKFLNNQGIDLSQVTCYHYTENEKGETPENGIDVDLEELLTTFEKEVKTLKASDDFDEHDRLLGELYRENQALKEQLEQKKDYIPLTKLEGVIEILKKPSPNFIGKVCSNYDHMHFLQSPEKRKSTEHAAKVWTTALYHELKMMLQFKK